MSDPSYHFVERLMDMNVEEAQREAEGAALRRQTTTGKKGRLHSARRWLLPRLGHLLVTAGERLVEYGLPRSMPQKRYQDA
jgi:imidazolonepropionase-like amidohydrolase